MRRRRAVPFQGPYVHQIDPIIATVLGMHLWWYGLGYTLGFLNAHLSIWRHRSELGFSSRAVYDLTILLAVAVLLGGRFVEVAFYEWPFYSEHPWLIPAYWLGGMSTHGLLFGGLVGIGVFALVYRRPFLEITDALAIPAAVIMGLGRLGNFVDGQIVGSETGVWWAVKFPDAEGFRHPVVLYDGIKNLLIVPVLMFIGGAQPPRGVRTGVFLFLYAFLRIFVDVFREYPTTLLGLATGQVLNISMSLVGLGLILVPLWKARRAAVAASIRPSSEGLIWRRSALAAILIFSLVMPSDWTQDVPARYGKRHPGLDYSVLYPRIDTAPPRVAPQTASLSTDRAAGRPTPPPPAAAPRRHARGSPRR
jgi:phosphatidylglycerol---prolipoprotein diacylglyceryl transferase